MTVDLHLHTLYSDGNWSPAELVEHAVELKLKHIAITDHDTMDGIAEAQAVAGNRLNIIPGVEINTVFCYPDGREQDVHILGYFLDKNNRELKALLRRQQEARLRLVEETIVMLAELGINLSLADVQASAGIGSIGRPHITKAIVEAGGAADVNDAYARFMQRESPHYVARKSVSPSEAVRAIRAAGGIASIAHPGKTDGIEKLILEMKAHGLQGVEAFHRGHSVEMIQHYIRFAHRNGLVYTGGSDCHGPYKEMPASIGTVSVPPEVISSLRALQAQS